MAPRLSGAPTIGSDETVLRNSWFMKTVTVPSAFRCAPIPSGIPTIWYSWSGLLVRGTRSPALRMGTML